jgi:hypothetical protein
MNFTVASAVTSLKGLSYDFSASLRTFSCNCYAPQLQLWPNKAFVVVLQQITSKKSPALQKAKKKGGSTRKKSS